MDPVVKDLDLPDPVQNGHPRNPAVEGIVLDVRKPVGELERDVVKNDASEKSRQ